MSSATLMTPVRLTNVQNAFCVQPSQKLPSSMKASSARSALRIQRIFTRAVFWADMVMILPFKGGQLPAPRGRRLFKQGQSAFTSRRHPQPLAGSVLVVVATVAVAAAGLPRGNLRV